MTERPILFSGAMVRAILKGRKTVTRRLLKGSTEFKGPYNPAYLEAHRDSAGWATICPYGVPGDRLWVRETWGYRGAAWNNQRPDRHEVEIAYRADDSRRTFIRQGTWGEWDAGLPKQHPPPAPEHDGDFDAIEARNNYFSWWWKSWRPSLHMPRWASRLTLEVVSVRVERLQEISEEDAKAEGVMLDGMCPPGFLDGRNLDPSHTYRGAFACLWDSINRKRASWESNPWAWRVEFKRVP